MNDQQRLNLKELIDKLRSVTIAVQVIPFIYTAIYIAVLVLYLFASDGLLDLIDAVFYISPISCLAFLWLSKALRLCKWHRTACLLPIVPHAFSAAVYTLIVFSNDFARIVIASTIAMAILLLIAAYKIFIKPDR